MSSLEVRHSSQSLPAFARFLIVGLVNTGVGYTVILMLQYVVGVDRRVANAGGYLIGGAVSYWLNRRYAFRSERPHGQAFPAFVLAALVCFGLNIAVLEICVSLLKWPGVLGQAAAITTYTLAFYAINRFHVFR